MDAKELSKLIAELKAYEKELKPATKVVSAADIARAKADAIYTYSYEIDVSEAFMKRPQFARNVNAIALYKAAGDYYKHTHVLKDKADALVSMRLTNFFDSLTDLYITYFYIQARQALAKAEKDPEMVEWYNEIVARDIREYVPDLLKAAVKRGRDVMREMEYQTPTKRKR